MKRVLFEEKVISKTDDYTVSIYTPSDMPVLAYAHIETDKFCMSRDLTTIYFQANKGTTLSDYTKLIDIPNDEIIKSMLEMVDWVEQGYHDAVVADNPRQAFVFCDKRDLVKQYFITMARHDFSHKAMYDWGCEIYSRCEDNYGYPVMVDALSTLRFNTDAKEQIEKEIRENLISEDVLNNNDFIRVYRGFSHRSDKFGTSYTIDEKIAWFFAKRWDNFRKNGDIEGYVEIYDVHIDDVIAFINGREKEIITRNAVLK